MHLYTLDVLNLTFHLGDFSWFYCLIPVLITSFLRPTHVQLEGEKGKIYLSYENHRNPSQFMHHCYQQHISYFIILILKIDLLRSKDRDVSVYLIYELSKPEGKTP